MIIMRKRNKSKTLLPQQMVPKGYVALDGTAYQRPMADALDAARGSG